MKGTHKKNHRFFTLIELMIGMAILVIQMGFLFQFVNSANKIWTASKDTEQVFDGAQLCFELIEKDLLNSYVQEFDVDFPELALPYSLTKGEFTLPGDHTLLIIHSRNQDSDIVPVVYYTIGNNLYRKDDFGNPLRCVGKSTAEDSNSQIGSFSGSTANEQYKICENIASLKIESPKSSGIHHTLPRFIRITVEIMDPSDVAQKVTNPRTRRFTKIILSNTKS